MQKLIKKANNLIIDLSFKKKKGLLPCSKENQGFKHLRFKIEDILYLFLMKDFNKRPILIMQIVH